MYIIPEIPFSMYKKGYIQELKGGRRYVYLYGGKNRRLISFARYIYSVYTGEEPSTIYDVDHINNDKTDDRIENLQLLLKKDNIRKSLKPPTMLLLTCPICGKIFEFRKSNLGSHPNPCCSRSCGAKKGHVSFRKTISHAKINKRNTSGYTGVRKVGKRWRATLCRNRTLYYLGYFDTPEEGHQAYLQKLEELQSI